MENLNFEVGTQFDAYFLSNAFLLPQKREIPMLHTKGFSIEPNDLKFTGRLRFEVKRCCIVFGVDLFCGC